MSAHSRGSRGSRNPRPAQDYRDAQSPRPGQAQDRDGATMVGWVLLVIAAALIGGLAAAALVHVSLVIAVIVAVVAAGIAIAVFRSPGRPAGRLTRGRDTAPLGRDASAAPVTAAAPVASSAPATAAGRVTAAGPATAAGPVTAAGPAGQQIDTAVQLLPLPAANTSRSGPPPAWWDAAQGAPPPSSPAAQRAPAPDLSTYLASTFIAQCPRCGAFRLDIARARSGWDFRCESCEYVWTWQPGTPWPPVRVMPGRRKESRPPSA